MTEEQIKAQLVKLIVEVAALKEESVCNIDFQSAANYRDIADLLKKALNLMPR